MSLDVERGLSGQRFLGARQEIRQSYWRKVDWVLLLSALALSASSTVFVWSASRSDLASGDPQYFLNRHLVNILIGLGLAFLVSRLDYRLLRAYTPFIYGAAILGVLLVWTPLGVTIEIGRAHV